jgi:DNA end-binding protein Ku
VARRLRSVYKGGEKGKLVGELDPVLFDSPYYLAPDKAPKPYVLLAKAMEAAGKVGVGRLVMRNKQYIAAIRAVDGQLVMSTMVYEDEVVSPSSIEEMADLAGVEVSDKELAMAGQLVESLAGTFDHDRYKDSYRQQVMDLIEKKAAGVELTIAERPSSSPAVIDLMAALEASVKAAKEARTRHPSTHEGEAEALPAPTKLATARKKKSA